jgi:hypothetical protein
MGMSQPSSINVTGDLESIDESVVHGEVEDGVQGSGTLVLRRKGNVVSKDFTHAENTSPGAKLAPEVIVHVFGS